MSDTTDVDLTNLHVNFSSEEASSEARSFEPLPTGSYDVYITDGEVKFSTSQKNPGKPFWALEMTVDGGPHDKRKLWANVMLFEGALFSLAQLLKATGHEEALKTGKVPGLDEIIGQKVTVTAKKQLDTYAMDRDGIDPKTCPPDQKLWKNEVKGFRKFGEASSTTTAGGKAKKGAGSLLP
jgi:hypothetical protein